MASTGQPGGYGEPSAREINLLEVWDVIWASRGLVLSLTLACALAALAYALLAHPVYEAKVVTVPADQESSGSSLSALANQFGGFAALAGIDLSAGGTKSDEAVQIMKTFAFASAFIQDEGLMPLLFPDADEDEVPSLQEAVKLFEDQVRHVYQDSKTGTVTVTVVWHDPQLAADWANRIISRINAQMKQRDIAVAQRSIDFLNEKLKETQVVEMRETLFRLIETQTRTVMLAHVSDEYVFKVIDPAFPPEEPSHPKRVIIVLFGLIGGGVLSLFVVWLRHLLATAREQASS